MIGRSSFLLSIGISALVAHSMGITDRTAISQVQPLVLFPQVSLQDLRQFFSPVAIPLGMFLVYMLTADIAGTPFQLIEAGAPDREKRVFRSFIVDSCANLLAPILCTSPTVYYAENNAAKLVGGQTGRVAVWTGAGFLVLAAAGLATNFMHISLLQFLPQVAVAPALFAVGLLIIAVAFGHRDADDKEWGEADSLPAAITIVLTPTFDLEIGLAAGLFAYTTYYLISPTQQGTAEAERRGPLVFLLVFAVIALLVRLMVTAP
jgi:xanthine/uracil/vitamin C permease (AzgA family)